MIINDSNIDVTFEPLAKKWGDIASHAGFGSVGGLG